MQDDNDKTPADTEVSDAMEKPFFSAVLTPYRALGSRGFLVLMLSLCTISFIAGIFLVSAGAWPVFGFFGLDVLLVWGAFRLNYASARAFEEIEISRTQILIRQVGPGRRHHETRFNPFWVRLLITELEDEGVTRIALSSRGETVEVGKFLNPDDRTSFAGALAGALGRAKAGLPLPDISLTDAAPT